MLRRAWAVVPMAVLALLTACGGSSNQSSSPKPSPPPSLHGAVPTSSQTRPEFTLRDTSGHTFDFGKQTSGRVTLLYAGYTHCPDECPTAMADLASALRKVPAAVADQVQVVFVTTDPGRDKPAVLRRWLDTFHPPRPYVGLTGTPGEIAGAEAALHMPISSPEPAPKGYGSGRYAVSHFAAVLVYGRDDRLATLYPSGVTPADIATDLQVLVKG